jgi:thioredoxin reductase (NADPH)
VIGGGSGGLSSAKEAAALGAKVGLADFVRPTPQGTKWGLGGTCVNVGCIPKKLMHFAGILYENIDEYPSIGYPEEIKKAHNWEKMVENVQTYIKKLNWGYRTSLRDKKVTYYNKSARIIDPHSIELTDVKGEKETITTDKILISVGGRPNYDYPGSKELCISSDDIFSLAKAPGKTLVIGASYIALECAGFLNALGYDTTVMVRSILLRGFDQDMAGRIGEYMTKRGTRFIYSAIPISFTKNQETGKIICEYKDLDFQENFKEEFDTVLLAIGRTPETKSMGLENLGIKISKGGKIVVDQFEKSSIDNIFSIGDCAEGRPELTPPAIMAGKYLSRRLFGGETAPMNYDDIATTVFTPLEYGCVGLTEDKSIETFGAENIKVYHSAFRALEFNYNLESDKECYLKVIVSVKDDKVLGFHLLSPNAGEITQGIAVAFKCGLTKKLLDSTVGIHPTIAEEFTTLTMTKDEGDGKKEGC